MASVEFKIKDDDLNKLLDKISSYQGNTEELVNAFLKNKAVPKAIVSIKSVIPVSNRMKEHAKDSDPLTSQAVNLGFIIQSKSKYNYLYFPDQAQGTSRKKDAIEFMQKGIDNVYNEILIGVVEQFDNAWKEK